MSDLEKVKQVLAEAEKYDHAASVLNYDQETICPSGGIEEQGEVTAFLQNQSFRLLKDGSFIEAAEALYRDRAGLGELDRALADQLHRNYLETKNISPEQQYEAGLILNKAFVDWSQAREASDYSMFEKSLAAVRSAMISSVF